MSEEVVQQTPKHDSLPQEDDDMLSNDLEGGIHDKKSFLRKSRRILGKTVLWHTSDAIPQPNSKRGTKYAQIPQERRMMLVNEVLKTSCTIKSAAKKMGINFSTAKAIMQIYRREGRIGKKEIRKQRKRRSAFGTQNKRTPDLKIRFSLPQDQDKEFKQDKDKLYEVSAQKPSCSKIQNLTMKVKEEFIHSVQPPSHDERANSQRAFAQSPDFQLFLQEVQSQKMVLANQLQACQSELFRQKQINYQLMLQLGQFQRENSSLEQLKQQFQQSYMLNFQAQIGMQNISHFQPGNYQM